MIRAESIVQQIQDCLRLLAADDTDKAEVRNGIGFSKFDVETGHTLAKQEQLSIPQAEYAAKMLQKYRKQIERNGLFLPSLSDVRVAFNLEDVEVNRREKKVARYFNDQIEVSFPYDPEIVNKLRNIRANYGGGGYNAENKNWYFSLSAAKAIVDLGIFEISDKVQEIANKAISINSYFSNQEREIRRKKTILELDKYTNTLVLDFEYSDKNVIHARNAKRMFGGKFDSEEKNWKFNFNNNVIDFLKIKFKDLIFGENLENHFEGIRIKEELAAKDSERKTEVLLSKIDLNSPMPDGRTLFKHQKDGIPWIIKTLNTEPYKACILADDTGIGKTITALMVAKAYGLPTLVICPVSVMKGWTDEAKNVGIDIDIFTWASQPEPLQTKKYFVILDEAHYMQNYGELVYDEYSEEMKVKGVRRTAEALDLVAHENCEKALLLTATPIKNGKPENLFPLLMACNHPLTKDKIAYEGRYCTGQNNASHLDELHEYTKVVILRRTKKQCLDLPDKTRVIRKAFVSDEDLFIYKEKLNKLRELYKKRLEYGEISDRAEAIVWLNHLIHASSYAKIGDVYNTGVEIVEEDRQIVVFTKFIDSGESLVSQFSTHHESAFLHGKLSKKKRSETIDAFTNGEIKSIVLTHGAGGVGINGLQVADTVVLMDRPWTPGDAKQAEDRVHRYGVKRNVTAIWPQFGKVDLKIDTLLVDKDKRSDLILRGKRKSYRGTQDVSDIAMDLVQDILEFDLDDDINEVA